MNKVLVIGGAGYVGSHTCKELHRAGYLPVVVDNLSRGNRWAVKWGPLIHADISDGNLLRQIMSNTCPVAVIHCAAHAYVDESVRQPLQYYQNNVVGTLNIIEAMMTSGVSKIIFSSSCATYGHPQFLPITEIHPQAPISPYGHSKLMVEQILRDCDHAHKMKHVSLRYFNAAGADPDGEIGEHHSPETHLIPLVIETALGKHPSISVYGNDYDTPDGTCIRDYIHVSDLASAHVICLDYLMREGASSDVFNLGNGKGFSVSEIIKETERITGKDIQTVIEKRREGDPPTLVGDASKFIKLLQWKPHFNEISTIIETAYKWHRIRPGKSSA